MKPLALIPARYASTRFPAKPLALLAGKPIVQHVYERVEKYIPDVYVATDDQRIYDCVQDFGGKAILTANTHQSGTDRCAEALCHIGQEYDVVVNVQGDEPFVAGEQLLQLLRCFDDATTDIATLVSPFAADTPNEVLQNPNTPKVVLDEQGFACYFSRSVIPHLRDAVSRSNWAAQHQYYKHIGLYAYRPRVLTHITTLPIAPLERAECLEQLRWLAVGYRIKVGLTTIETIGIDTPQDLEAAHRFLQNQQP